MAHDLVTTTTLQEVREDFEINFAPIMLAMYFPTTMTFPTQEVMFEKVNKDVPMAAFVSPMSSGKPRKRKGSFTTSFQPAYIKATDTVDPSENLRRRPGEAIGGELSPEERRLALKFDLLQDQEKSILQRLEVMCTDMMYDGACIIQGEDYPTQHVDFGRRDENTITLSGAAKWDTVDPETYDPTVDIETWAENSKAAGSNLIFDKAGWAKFISFKAVRDKRDTTQRGETTSIQTGPTIKRTAVEKSFQYKGMFGEYALWVYSGEVMDLNGTKKTLARTKTLLIAPSSGEGTMAYGAIIDAEANAMGVVETDRYPSNWFTKNPSVEWLQTQSSPVPVPDNVDNYVTVTLW